MRATSACSPGPRPPTGSHPELHLALVPLGVEAVHPAGSRPSGLKAVWLSTAAYLRLAHWITSFDDASSEVTVARCAAR